jgi:hypothetical protein
MSGQKTRAAIINESINDSLSNSMSNSIIKL